ncbi:Stringent starvation protein A [Pseudovibrio axinellae]|uniref:glutathione transferase n=1 Tax=Pseudovibrio axinellae TaxID=989403 RepID=A0A165Z153_9HYPH|nr:glutathione S-transferase family protein [Pseudovibrio axinellae]KZL19420.1 Stringent starvation protein A [Pseudovibrio axinellae]SER59392.1 glutathione S-transferase [Pseudovibrio axinellae]
MLKVISFKICPFVQRVTAMLEAKQMPYEIEYISLKDKPDWFLDISPNAQVPVLVTENGTALFESDAIVEYIDEIAPPLHPALTPEQKAVERAWSYQASKNYLVQCSTMRSRDEATLEERAPKLHTLFAKAERQVSGLGFFSSSKPGNVDMAWLPLLHRAAIVEKHSGYDFVKDFPAVKAWQKRLLETGLAEKSVSDDFEKMFSDFYLSDQTFLGAGKCCDAPTTDSCKTGTCC